MRMKMTNPNDDSWYNDLVNQFEDALKAGSNPVIENFVANAGERHSELLFELLEQEIRYHNKAGDSPNKQNYYSRFPEHINIVDNAFGAICENRPSPLVLPQALSSELRSPFGAFRIIREIGQGGMGVVYLAMNTDRHQDVAIKLLHPKSIKQNGIEVLRNEAARLISLQHPNIVKVYGLIDTEQVGLAMVMEYIEGVSLKSLIKTRKSTGDWFDWPWIVDKLSQILEALEYAHCDRGDTNEDFGIIHCDLKPGNILYDNNGDFRLIDFGLSINRSKQQLEPRLIAGTLRYMAPEQLRGERNWLKPTTDIWSIGVILYELLSGELPYGSDNHAELLNEIAYSPPRQLRHLKRSQNCPDGLQEICSKCLRPSPFERYQTAGDLLRDLRLLSKGHSTLTRKTRKEKDRPYRGLLPFREQDANLFFGRQRYIDLILEKCVRSSLVAVTGRSGSGKSSLVLAGVLPALRRMEEIDILVVRPGSLPWDALASSLISVTEPDLEDSKRILKVESVAKLFADGKGDRLLREILARTGRRLVIVIDQFEELYTHCDDSTCTQFINTILRLIELYGKRGSQQLLLILTLRADFYSQILSSGPLTEAIQNCDIKVGPMQRDELREAIVQPVAGLADFQAGLVDRILDDAGEVPGNLPLLEFALTQLWDRCDYELSHSDYESIGKLSGAIAKQAESEFRNLSKNEKSAARRLLMRMVRVSDDGGEETRRRCRLVDLLGDSITGEEEVRSVLDSFTSARLLVMDRDETVGHETVEVAHEALIRSWPRLRTWLHDDRDFISWRQQIQVLIDHWRTAGRDHRYLIRGPLLDQALLWQATRETELSEMEKLFIDTSSASDRLQASAQPLIQYRIKRDFNVEDLRKLLTGMGVEDTATDEMFREAAWP